MTVGATLSELTAFTDTALGMDEDDDEDFSIGGRGPQRATAAGGGGGGNSRSGANALGAYLNAARQAAETAKKVEEALQADRAIFSRQQQQQLVLSQQLQKNKKHADKKTPHENKR